MAWGSSVKALRDIIERVLDTPGGDKQLDFVTEGKSSFVFSLNERRNVLNPIASKLVDFPIKQDEKVKSLLKIIDFYCPKEKVIVFCERRSTAYYVEQAVAEFLPFLRVFSTVELKNETAVERNEYQQKKLLDIEEAISQFAPIANKAKGEMQEAYHVFISTDAFGVGVNMQDASIVVNYDLAWTPIEPIQRAGRILRPWHEPRTLLLYTFVPTIKQKTNLKYQLLKISQRWDKLMQRNDESRKLTHLPVLTDLATQTVNLPDFAPDITVERGRVNLEADDDAGVSPYYQHLRMLRLNEDYAKNLSGDLVSALNYSGKSVLLYLLIYYQNEYCPLLYNPKSKDVESPSTDEVLELIKCEQETEVAFVEASEVEALSHDCLRTWCEQNNILESDVIRECTLYLKPMEKEDSISELLT